ncbi:MAG: YqfO family protein [Candidatus Saganbacteria bacterium]|nr:YqfO family protein [Candidatus Saganbacteria bacterium]
MKHYKFVVFVPKSHAEKVRAAMCKAGAGKIGNYDNCTFMSEGIGTYRPLKGAKPFKGEKGKIERAKEVRIETLVPKNKLKQVVAAMKKVHPYEEPAYDVYELKL